MYKQKQINTNQFAKKMGEIEYWFKKESEGILKTFKEVQKGQYLTEVAIQKTCRDMEFIQQFTNMGSYRQQSSENSIMQQNYMTQSSKDIEVRSNQNIANKNYKFITQDYTSDEKSYDQSIEIGMESLKMLQGNLNKNIISTLGHDSTQELNYKSSKSQEIKEESQGIYFRKNQDEMYQSEESSLRRSIDNKSLQNSPNKTKNSQKQSQDSSSSNKQSRVKSSYKQSQTTSLNPSNKEEVIDEIPKVLTHDDLDGYQVQRQLQKNMQLSAVPTSISAHTEENLKSQNTSTNQNKSLISENQKKIDQIIQKLGNKFNVDDITDLIMEQLLQELQDDNIVFTNKLDKSTKSVSSARSPKNMDKQFQEQFIVKSPNIKQTIDKVIADDIIGQNGSASTISNKSLGGYGSPEEIIRDVTKELENSNQIYQLSIKTNLAFIHEFMNCLLQVIKDGYQNELIRILNSYANFSALERLALVNQIVQIRNNENSLQLSFTNFNSSVVFNLRYQQQSKKENMLPDELLEAIYQKYYTNSQHNQYFSVHSKLVFDAFNESLQLFRAQKYINSTVPWKNFFNHYNQKQIQPQQVEKILEKCKDRVIEWASSICGFIPDKEDSPVNNLNVQLDDEYLGQIKEERMAKMLQNEVLENVENWTLYEDEEAEIQIEVSNIIFDHLIHDLVTEIMCLQKQRSQSSYFA